MSVRKSLLSGPVFLYAFVMAGLLAVDMPTVLQAQAPPATVGSSTIPPPEHPITRDQLQLLLTEMKSIETEKTHLREALEAQRKIIPAWFPAPVWTEFTDKVEAIDIVDIDLPVYEKYVSREQADALILFLQGPTGEEIGQHMADRALSALRTGARGSAADAQAMQAGAEGGDLDLWTKRVRELTPEQTDKIVPLLQSLGGIWRQIDDEQDVAFNKKANEIFIAVQKAHQPELRAAKQAADRSATVQSTTPH